MRHAADRSSAAEQATIRRGGLRRSLLNAESGRAHRFLLPVLPNLPKLDERRDAARPTVEPAAGDQRRAGPQRVTRLAIALAFLLVASPAWGQTPTLVQHYYTGTNSPPRGLTATNYTFRLPNKVLSGNCLIMFLDYPHGVSVSSITDDGPNTWPAPAVTADRGVGSAVTAAYVLPDAASGSRVITVTFTAAVAGVHAVFLEYYNVAISDPVGGTASRTAAAAPTISSGPLSPSPAASGNLVLHYAMDNVGQVGGENATAVTAWASGSGWTMLGGDINNSHDTSSFALQARIADGTNFNPTMTATQAVADTFNSLAVELQAASAGTAPAAGIRIIKQQFYVNTALTVPGSWTEFFPAQGNLLAAVNIYPGSTTSAITDSNGNTWTQAHTDLGTPAIQYAQHPTTGSTLTVTVPLTNANSNTTITLYDITGAATSSVLAQAVTVDDTNANNASVINHAPSITPLNPNGLIIVATGLGQGPVTGFASGAPATALFMPVTYPGETDFDTFDNADGYAHTYYGPSLTQQNYNWTLPPQVSNSWSAAAVEFVAGSAPQTITVTMAAPASAVYNTSFAVAATASSGLPVAIMTTGGCTGAGSDTATVTMTSGGTACVVHYNQAGDATWAFAPEVTSSTTAQLAAQSVVVTTGAPGNALYGTSFGVAAIASSGLPVAITATGGCTGAGAGSASITMTSGGTACVVHYNQAGTANFSPALEVTSSTTAQPAGQSITVTTPAPASAFYNASFTVAATASSGLPLAVTTTGGCSGSGTGSATVTMTSSTAACVVHYNQGGNGAYSAAPEVTGSTAAQKAAQTITVTTPAPGTAIYHTSFAVAAVASSGLPVAITTIGSCSGGGSGSASITMTAATSSCTVRYNQAGNGNYLAAPQKTGATTAQRAAQGITVTAPAPSTAAYHTSFMVAAHASSGLPVAIAGTGGCSGGGNSAGANVKITMTSATAACTVHYNQAGNGFYAPAPELTSSSTAQIAGQSISVKLAAPASAPFKGKFNVVATASSSLPVAVTATGACSGGGSSNGNYVQITMTSATGTCTVHYNQAGNGNYTPATEVTSPTVAQPAPQGITVTLAAPGHPAYNGTFNVVATASSSLPVAITTTGVCSGSGSGSASVTMTSGTGSCVVMFNQAGNSNYLAAPQKTQTATALKVSQTITVTTPAPASAASNTSFLVAATASTGLPVAISPQGICSGGGSGSASITMTSPTGTCSVHFTQAGDADFSAAPPKVQVTVAH